MTKQATTVTNTRTRSWKPEVQVRGEGDKWTANGLRFATEREAQANARDLMRRWTLVTNCRASESDDPPNYEWDAVKRELIPIR